MQYSAQFRNLHRTIGRSSISIEQLASIANPAALGLNERRDFYEPVSFALRLTHDGDALVIGVPVAENDNWLAELKRRAGATLALPVATLEFRTMNQVPVERLSLGALTSSGHLDVYSTGTLVRRDKLPTVPIEFSARKQAALGAWVAEGLGRALTDKIVADLVHKDAHEIETAILPNGCVTQTIREHFVATASSAGNWAEMARKYHVDSPATMSAAMGDQILKSVTHQVLRSIRSHINAGGARIHKHIASRKALQAEEVASQLSSKDAALCKPVLLQQQQTSARTVDGQKFFRSLVTGALASAEMRQGVINSIYRAPLAPPCGASATPSGKSAAKPAANVAATNYGHPWYRHTHEVLLPLRGTFTSDYMARHTKQNMSISAPYEGNALQALQRYHLYSGRMPVPPGLVVRGGVPQPIECHNRGDKKWKKKHHRRYHHTQSQVTPAAADGRRLLSIAEIVGRPMPELRAAAGGHIQAEMRSRLVSIADDYDEEEGGEDAQGTELELPPLDDLFK